MGALPAQEVAVEPEPQPVDSDGTIIPTPDAIPAPVIDTPAPVPTDVTADTITGIIPLPSDLPTDQPIEKPLTDEQVQNVRDQMPIDVEQVLKAIAKEAALEAIQETVTVEAIVRVGLPEPGQPSS